jgi:hypothetical protein
MSNHEVSLAVAVAGLVNVAMIILAARAFHDGFHDQITEIETAYRALTPLLGLGAAGLFLLALLASGFSSSIVAVMAGQAIMQGFVSFCIPLWLRRLVVMAPSFVVVVAGMDITHALLLSQVILRLVLPIPMVALVRFTARRDVMGEFANTRLTNMLAVAATGFVCLLNSILLLEIAAQTILTNLTRTTVSLPDPTDGARSCLIYRSPRHTAQPRILCARRYRRPWNRLILKYMSVSRNGTTLTGGSSTLDGRSGTARRTIGSIE